MIALYFVYYSFYKVHTTLQVTSVTEVKPATCPIYSQQIVELTSQFLYCSAPNSMDQTPPFRSAFIKLWVRHISERDALALKQKTVLALVREQYVPKFLLIQADRMACVRLKNEQSARLINLMVRHQHECRQMKASHQRDELSLDQVYRTVGKDSTKDSTFYFVKNTLP